MTGSYAVLWREGEGPIYAGKAELGPRALRLDGSCHGRHPSFRAVPYDELAGLSLTQDREECLYGKLTLMLELRDGGVIDIASLNGPGTVRELRERIAAFVPGVPVD